MNRTYYEDLVQRIDRDEVTALVAVVKHAAQALLPGVTVICCGSYRRGRPNSGDVDILITHRDMAPHIQHERKQLLPKLLSALKSMKPPFLIGMRSRASFSPASPSALTERDARCS